MRIKISLIFLLVFLLSCFLLARHSSFQNTSFGNLPVKTQKETVAFSHKILKDFNIFRDPQNFAIKDDSINWFYYKDVSNREILYEDTVFSSNLTTYVYRTPEDASIYSPIIVIGEVIDIYYTDSLDIFPPSATIFDFKISSSLRGDFVKHDIISIVEYGGYIRTEYNQFTKAEYSAGTSDLIKVRRRANTPEPLIGDEYVLFLQPSNIITGAYDITGEWMGLYRITSDGMVSRFLSEDTFWVFGALDELIATVEATPFNADLYNKRFSNS